MSNNRKHSRRAVVGSLACAPIASTAAIAGEVGSDDTDLLKLGHQFEEAVRALDDSDWADEEALARLTEVEGAILNTQATAMEGLCVKARAACWALLGDLDPTDEPTTDRRMAVSIVRDLIRLHDPSLENSGALKRLVEDLA